MSHPDCSRMRWHDPKKEMPEDDQEIFCLLKPHKQSLTSIKIVAGWYCEVSKTVENRDEYGEGDIDWNHGDKPIMIVTEWHPSPLGGAAIYDECYSVMPGDGIDIKIVGLKKEKPKNKICKFC